ncbi:hypothetical protein WA026_003655 [Henosepilachna vigintioctopunctata]|uniref:Acyltransferase 3 domain-containing protein n=1 Tax=Henosepilachna vigintioctopunctata TaxID=420089 RepID=A0AAW1UCY2_9CUCU
MSVERVKTLEKDPSFLIATPKFIILMVTMGIILLLSIVGTTIDVKRHNKDKQFNMAIGQDLNSKMKEKNVSEVELVKISQESLKSKNSLILDILRSFSVYSNVRALVNTNLPSDSIRCIHGIRFFGMLWVIMIHSVFFQADYVKDPPFAYRMSEDLSSQILSNSTYSVDTYLFLSGFLVAYLYYKSKRTSGSPVNYLRKLNEFCMMCFNRFVRLTPPYLFVIILTDVVFTYLRQTSSLESSEQPDVLCSKYWWRNVLYINNLYPRSEMCLSWSWYMSLDTQAFVISAMLLIVSTFAFKFAASSLIVLILGSMLVTAYKSYSISYIPTMDEQLVHLDDIYDLPWNRIGPYLVGTATGYFLVEKLQYKLVLGKPFLNYLFEYNERLKFSGYKAILWILFPLLNLWILFTLYTRQLSVEFSAVYMGISRTLWGIGLAWTLLACCTGNADRMNKFLSFPGWIPMSRLTFCAYLLNPLVTNSMFLGTEMGFDSSTSGYAITILGIAFATFFWAFVVSLFFESPFILITKILLRGISRTPSNVGNSNTQKP